MQKYIFFYSNKNFFVIFSLKYFNKKNDSILYEITP